VLSTIKATSQHQSTEVNVMLDGLFNLNQPCVVVYV
jgi:hypothetical protein